MHDCAVCFPPHNDLESVIPSKAFTLYGLCACARKTSALAWDALACRRLAASLGMPCTIRKPHTSALGMGHGFDALPVAKNCRGWGSENPEKKGLLNDEHITNT